MKANSINREHAAHTTSTGTASRLGELSALVLVMLYVYAGTGPGMINLQVSSDDLVLAIETIADAALGRGDPGDDLGGMRMVERGLPGLDDEVSQYLDEPGNPKRLIVLRQLRDHTSGLPGPC